MSYNSHLLLEALFIPFPKIDFLVKGVPREDFTYGRLSSFHQITYPKEKQSTQDPAFLLDTIQYRKF